MRGLRQLLVKERHVAHEQLYISSYWREGRSEDQHKVDKRKDAEAFEAANALDKLEMFASFNGPDFYHLPRNQTQITLVKESWDVPQTLPFADSSLVPMRAGNQIAWKVVS